MPTEDSVVLAKQKLDFQNLLLHHMDRISTLTAFIPRLADPVPQGYKPLAPDVLLRLQRDIQNSSLSLSIRYLESLIWAYRDEKYKKACEELVKQHKGKTDTADFVMDKSNLLMEMLSRLGLLLHKDTELSI